MKTFNNKFKGLTGLLSACIIFFSCQKDLDYISVEGQGPDLITKVNSSVSGFVTDENNAAVKDAAVLVGSMNTTTDKYGYFEIKNVSVVKNAAVVTVNKNGYFKGIKTYAATNEKAAFFRIKLIPKIIVGSINAVAGGNMTLSNGLIVSLPPNAVVVAAGNTAYTGTIQVAAHWINPAAADLDQTMPGDLRGIDETGSLKGLTTYGMAAVELTAASGELLQIVNGKKATLTIPLPTAAMATAPSSILLWYFDEATGLWKQEGNAIKTGNSYVGEVSHFSYWNCDFPNAIVPLTFTVVDQFGNPVPNVFVGISSVPASWGHISGYTDSTGYVAVFVTANTQYILEVYSSCGFSSGYITQNFSVGSTAVNLGNVAVLSNNIATLTGTVTDCNNNAVTNGYIIIQNGNMNFRQFLSNTGSYSYSTLLCTGPTNFTLIGEDINSAQQSTALNHTLTAGINNISNLQACAVSVQEFFNYSVNGNDYSITYPTGSFIEWAYGSTMRQVLATGNNSNAVTIFSQQNIGLNSIQQLGGFKCSQIQDSMSVTTPVNVQITEFGNVGEYISGSFSGSMTGIVPPNNTYNVSCSFRVKRSF